MEGKIILNGIVLNFIDTAGIRETSDIVEKIGIQKSQDISQNADLIIYVIDNTSKDTKEDIDYLKSLKNKNIIIFVNKNDQESKFDQNKFANYNLVFGNTVTKEGLNNLKQTITNLFNLENLETKDYTYLSNARQISLVKAKDIIEQAINSLNNEAPIDLITVDLRNCYETLGEIIGATYKEDLLNELFSKFCLGK